MHDPGGLGQDIAQFVADPKADALGAALLVGRALTEDFDAPGCRSHLDNLADDCPPSLDPWIYLADLGFSGSGGDFDAVNNSRLDWVLDNRQGIPISLGVLLIHVSQRSGREAVGINFPGHFLVQVGSQLVDPLTMASVSQDECLTRFGQGQQAPAGGVVALFQEAEPRTILLRMLNNVKYQFASAAEWDRALDMVDWQLCVQGDSAQLFLERGELWRRLGGTMAARAAYEQAMRVSGDSQLRAAAQSRLANLGADEVVH